MTTAVFGMQFANNETSDGLCTLLSLGDSLSAGYAGTLHGVGHQSWSDLLASRRRGRLRHFNYAQPGATSTVLLSQGQHVLASHVLQTFHAHPGTLPGSLPFATLLIGANDVSVFAQQYALGMRPDPVALVDGVVRSVRTALDTLDQAGPVGVLVGTVPDITRTPKFQTLLTGQMALARLLAVLTGSINEQLLALAKARRSPAVDLYGLNNLPSAGPLWIGGSDVRTRMYGVDGFHPSTLGQGLLCNTVLAALQRGFGLDVSTLLLSDPELLQAQGLPSGTEGRYDITSFVIEPPLNRECRNREDAA